MSENKLYSCQIQYILAQNSVYIMNIRVYTPLAHLQVMKHIILCDEFNLQSVTVKMCDIVKSKYNFWPTRRVLFG